MPMIPPSATSPPVPAPAASGPSQGTADLGCLWPAGFRCLLAALQAATILVTWPTWQPRSLPPLLPLVPLPPFDAALPLLACLAVLAIRPIVGLPLYAVALAVAIIGDQTRMQPHMLSMLFLACGTLGRPEGTVIARASLVALWFFAGVHKLTSPDFFSHTAPWLLAGIAPGAPLAWSITLGIAIGAVEIALAVGSLIPRARPATAAAAFAFHAATLLTLSPLGMDWNREVWPWNAALAAAGPALVLPWRGPGLGAAWSEAARWGRAAAVALLIVPVGFWFGVVDPLLAHCLYSENVPRAFVCTPFSRTDIRVICDRFGVQVPPAHRHFEPLFRGVGRAGEWLEIEDPRWIARLRGRETRTVLWTDLPPSSEAASPTADP